MPRSGRLPSCCVSLLLAALPIWMAAQSSACPFLAIINTTTTYSEIYGACANCSPDLDLAFGDPVNPENKLIVTFEITSPDALDVGDAFAELRLRCGNGVGGFKSFPVTLTSAGLTRLTGRFEGTASSLCVGSTGQRSPALWSVYVRRNISGQSVTFNWDMSYTSYLG